MQNFHIADTLTINDALWVTFELKRYLNCLHCYDIAYNANYVLKYLGQNHNQPVLMKLQFRKNGIFELYELNADYEFSYQGSMSRSKLNYVVFTFGSSGSNNTALFTDN